MNIAINLRQYFKGKIGGMENYVRHVVGGILARQDIFHEVAIFVLESEAPHVREFAPCARLIALPLTEGVDRIERELESGNYDLLFCPLLVLEPLRSKIASAVTIPDLQHEYYPEFFSPALLAWRKQNYRPSVHIADVIFTISAYSKRSIVEKLAIEAAKVIVVDLDVDEEFRQPSSADSVAAFNGLRLPSNYLYFPANFWPHKNHTNLLRALRILVDGRHPDLSLVLTGAAEGAAEVKKLVAKLGLRKHVRLLDYQRREVVAEIYRRGRALTFVSKFEGFGIPIIEAFHTGCPVVCSASCSCPEVADGAAVLVDENDPQAIAAGVGRVLEDARLVHDLAEKGSLRAKRYSWQNAIDATIETLTAIPAAHAARATASVETWPVVSITTPSYNMARFIEETIESVLSQDYPHIEYIVMDGGSNDGTIDILRKYRERLRYVSERDKGQADAINRGFAVTRGPIFTYLNADDTYLPGAVGTAVRHLRDNPHVGMVYGEAYYVDESGRIISSYPTHAPDIAYLNRNCYICQPASFMWRHAFEQAGWMNADQQFALDYDLWMRMVKLFPILKIDEYLATSRMYAENKTIGKRSLVYREILQSVRTHFGYVPFDWAFGYACYLADRRDQFFEKTKPSRFKFLLSLGVGLYYNPLQCRRYWNEWLTVAGISWPSNARWSDGWISKCYKQQYDIAPGCAAIRIAGKHWAAFSEPLTLTVRLNGAVLGARKLDQHGPFILELPCPAKARGRRGMLQISADQTFRPVGTGDPRKLSCIIDEITFADGE